jgi:hypothetical protein
MSKISVKMSINPLKAELNPICHLLALLGAHFIFHVSRIRVNLVTKYMDFHSVLIWQDGPSMWSVNVFCALFGVIDPLRSKHVATINYSDILVVLTVLYS